MICKVCKRAIPQNSLFCCWCGTYQLSRKVKKTSVPTPKRLPSGSWRIYLEREKKSITASTPDDCILQATEYREQWEIDEAAGLHIPPPPVLTLDSVVREYITSREPVRSPSTIDGYYNILRNRFQKYMRMDVNLIDYQQMINDELELVSAKTVRNAWGLVNSALVQSKVVFKPPTLPRVPHPDRRWLDFNQILLFLNAISGSPYELPALLAIHGLRKSELLGLKVSDYDAIKKIIRIRGALVATKDGYIYTRLNKTDASSRDVPIIIPKLAALLDDAVKTKTDYIVTCNPDLIYKNINLICKSVGLPEIGLHGLRHSFASLAYHLNWKKMSTQQIGGWRNSKVLDEIYTHNADLKYDLGIMQDFFVQNTVQE